MTLSPRKSMCSPGWEPCEEGEEVEEVEDEEQVDAFAFSAAASVFLIAAVSSLTASSKQWPVLIHR